MGHDEGLRMWDWPVVQASNHEWVCDAPFAEIHISSNPTNTTYWVDVAFKGEHLEHCSIERNFYKALPNAVAGTKQIIASLFTLARQWKHIAE